MGESPKSDDQTFTSNAWIELTVQKEFLIMLNLISIRLIIVLMNHLMMDFDGVWNDDEHWLDLNKMVVMKKIM